MPSFKISEKKRKSRSLKASLLLLVYPCMIKTDIYDQIFVVELIAPNLVHPLDYNFSKLNKNSQTSARAEILLYHTHTHVLLIFVGIQMVRMIHALIVTDFLTVKPQKEANHSILSRSNLLLPLYSICLCHNINHNNLLFDTFSCMLVKQLSMQCME